MVDIHRDADYSLQNLNRVRLNIRKDLVWTRQKYNNVECYLISDPLTSANYRVGIAEHALIASLESGLTVGEALQKTASTWELDSFSEHEAARIVQWLVNEGLATTRESSSPVQLRERLDKKRKPVLEKVNLITFRLPITYPDRFYTRIYPYCSWSFGGAFFATWLLVVLVGGYLIAANFDRFQHDAGRVFAPQNVIWLVVIWVILKVIHESAHALVCKRYGGRIYEIGIFFILFIPLAYVDVSSMWQFRSKWHRMHVAAAGMYVEIFIGAIAAIVWCFGEQSSLNYIAHNTVVVAVVGTLLFNANALMRFDGYHLLSDFMEIPNLYSRGQAQLLAFGQRLLAPNSEIPPQVEESKKVFVFTYAVAALFWRMFVMLLLIYLSSRLLHGVGSLFATFAVLSWFVLPLFRCGKYISSGLGDGRVAPRSLVTAVTILILGGATLFVVPISTSYMVPGYAEYDDAGSVRVETEGFVRQVLVEPFSAVHKGQALLRLENKELEKSLLEVNLEIAKVMIKRNGAVNRKMIAEDAALLTHLKVLETKKTELENEIKTLTVIAKESGVVIAPTLRELEGQFLNRGTEVAIIADESRKLVRAFLDTKHSMVAQDAGNDIMVIPETAVHQRFSGKILETKPRVVHELDFIGITAQGGGTLPTSTQGNTREGAQNAGATLLTPVVEISVGVSKEAASQLFSGQRVRIKLSKLPEPLGLQLVRKIAPAFKDSALW